MEVEALVEVFQSGDIAQVRELLDDVIEQQDPAIYEHFLQKGSFSSGVPKPHKASGLSGRGAAKRSTLYAFLALVATAPQEAKIPKALRIEKIQHLDLSKCKFEEIPEEIGLLRHLEILDLRYNKLADLPESLADLTELEQVYLAGNKFKALPDAACGWEKVAHLSLDNIPLKTLSPHMGEMKGLTSLYIRGAKLKAIPELGEIEGLERCVLIDLPLTSLPETLTELPHFRRIDISDCPKLLSVPDAFWGMESMEVLYVSGIPVRSIPPNIGDCKKLKILDIDAKDMEPLPPEIGQLEGLETLIIRNLKQDTLPAEIGQLASLQELVIEQGQCHSLPAQIGSLAKLKRLRIHHVEGLEELPALTGTEALEEIDIYDVPLRALPDTSHLSSLETVKAEYTQIPD